MEKVIIAGNNNDSISSVNYEYNEDEVFCLDPANVYKKDSVTTASSSKEPRVFQDSGTAIQNHLGRGYNAVKAARRAVSSLRLLNPTPVKSESVTYGSFMSAGDARVLRTRVICSISTRIFQTSSFDTATGRCISCAGGGHDAFVSGNGGPVALVVADQAFPACLPVWRGGGECLRVLRVEDASLRELTLALADGIGNKKLVEGTVICMGSLAHLASVGTGQYCTDWVKSRWWIKERFGGHVLVVPLPPVPVGGISGKSLIR